MQDMSLLRAADDVNTGPSLMSPLRLIAFIWQARRTIIIYLLHLLFDIISAAAL